MNGKRYTDNRRGRNGFYLALAVCLVAVGVAAWSTYDAVSTYSESQRQNGLSATLSASPSPSAAPNAASPRPSGSPTPNLYRDDVPGESSRSSADRDDPQAPRQTPAATPRPESSSPLQEDARPTAGQPVSEEEQVPVNGPLYEISEELIWPISGTSTQKAYSAGAPVYSETMKDWRIHTGTDLACEPGAEVFACGAGKVLRCYSDRMLGNVVLIEHGDYQISYCGVAENFAVAEGDLVQKGQRIGTVTAVPSEAADEPHLHIEIRRDGVPIDPQELLKGNEE